MEPLVVIASSTVGWPALELAVFWVRFRHLPPNGPADALVFAPMGLVAGLVAALLMSRASSSCQRQFVLWGYAAASPFALLGGLLGGLVLAGIWGPLVFGAGPLAIGCVVGFALARTHDAGAV